MGQQITMSNKFKSTSHSVIIALIVSERFHINLETYIRFPNEKRMIIRSLKFIQWCFLSKWNDFIVEFNQFWEVHCQLS